MKKSLLLAIVLIALAGLAAPALAEAESHTLNGEFVWTRDDGTVVTEVLYKPIGRVTRLMCGLREGAHPTRRGRRVEHGTGLSHYANQSVTSSPWTSVNR